MKILHLLNTSARDSADTCARAYALSAALAARGHQVVLAGEGLAQRIPAAPHTVRIEAFALGSEAEQAQSTALLRSGFDVVAQFGPASPAGDRALAVLDELRLPRVWVICTAADLQGEAVPSSAQSYDRVLAQRVSERDSDALSQLRADRLILMPEGDPNLAFHYEAAYSAVIEERRLERAGRAARSPLSRQSSRRPLISVLMPMRNAGRYLEPAVKSVLDQTLDDFEFLIVDDASTDRSRQIVDGFGDPRVRVIQHAEKQGVARSLNDALSQARGQYIARADADDISLPRRFEQQVDFLERSPDVALIGSAMQLIDEHDRPMGFYQFPTHPVDLHWELRFGNHFLHPSVLMRRDALVHVGGYDARVREAEDHHLWVRLSRTQRLANFAHPLLLYRRHASQGTVRMAPSVERWQSWIGQIALADELRMPISPILAEWWKKAWKGQLRDGPHAVRVVGSVLLRLAGAIQSRYRPGSAEAQRILALASSRLGALQQMYGGAYPGMVESLLAGGALPPEAWSVEALRPEITPLPLDGRRQSAFLHLVDWKAGGWREVVAAYARAFAPHDDVSLVLWVDPHQGIAPTEIETGLLDALGAAGADASTIADVLLVVDELSAVGRGRLHAAVDWSVPHGDLVATQHAREWGVPVLEDLSPSRWRAAANVPAALDPAA